MEKKLTIQLGEYQIVAEIYDTVLGVHNCKEDNLQELNVYIRDANGAITQDICTVRPHSRYNERMGEFVTDNDFVDCLVWGDSDDEDYTDKHVIGVYKGEDN